MNEERLKEIDKMFGSVAGKQRELATELIAEVRRLRAGLESLRLKDNGSTWSHGSIGARIDAILSGGKA